LQGYHFPLAKLSGDCPVPRCARAGSRENRSSLPKGRLRFPLPRLSVAGQRLEKSPVDDYFSTRLFASRAWELNPTGEHRALLAALDTVPQ